MIKTNLQKDFEYQSHKAAVARLEKQLREAKGKQYFSSSLQARTTIDSFVIPTANTITSWFTEAFPAAIKNPARGGAGEYSVGRSIATIHQSGC